MLPRLKKRHEFVRASRSSVGGGRPGLVVKAVANRFDESPIRVGFTASRKVGGAVARNRAKRRMRALAEELLPSLALPGYDYVLIARSTTPTRAYSDLRSDLAGILRRVRKDIHEQNIQDTGPSNG